MSNKELTFEEMMEIEKKITEAISKGDFKESDRLEKILNTIPDKNLKKVSRHDPDLINAVRYCMSFNLTYEQSIKEIKKYGFKIETKTFQRIKSELKKENNARFEQISKKTPLIINSMGMVDVVIAGLFDIIKNSNDPWPKLKAAKMILESLVLQGKLWRYPNPW